MRNMKRMIAVAMLAVFATLGAQTAMANNGVLLSDNHRDGVLLSDHAKDGVLLSDKSKYDVTTMDIINLALRMVDGVLLSD